MEGGYDMNEKVTGKKVLTDCAVLVRDLGIYLYELGKSLALCLKKALAPKDEEKCKKEATCKNT